MQSLRNTFKTVRTDLKICRVIITSKFEKFQRKYPVFVNYRGVFHRERREPQRFTWRYDEKKERKKKDSACWNNVSSEGSTDGRESNYSVLVAFSFGCLYFEGNWATLKEAAASFNDLVGGNAGVRLITRDPVLNWLNKVTKLGVQLRGCDCLPPQSRPVIIFVIFSLNFHQARPAGYPLEEKTFRARI